MLRLSYTINPGYLDLFANSYRALQFHCRAENWPKNYSFPYSFFDDLKMHFHLTLLEAIAIISWSIAFTGVRYFFETLICKPMIKSLNIDKKSNREKFPESIWKSLVYSLFWSYCLYLLILCGKYDYFTRPFSIWDGKLLFKIIHLQF